MLGAIIGDIAGSRFEFANRKSKHFTLFTPACSMTDDSYMTLAIADALLKSGKEPDAFVRSCVGSMQAIGRRHPNCGFGGRFAHWVTDRNPQPYGSFGNGAAMRVSPCGYAAATLDEAKALARLSCEPSHNHPESYKAAEAVAAAIFMARQGSTLPEIRAMVTKEYYPLNFTLDELRPKYRFDVTCQGSVPQAFEALFESTGFEDAIRNAVSIGGDSDTIAAITGGMAEAVYGIPDDLRRQAMAYFDEPELADILRRFEAQYPAKL